MLNHRWTFGSTLVVAACFLFGALQAPVGASEYRLGPQDRIRVKVHEWRGSTGEVFAWDALADDFSIESDGLVSLPLVGDINASGLKPEELAGEISRRLQQKVGLTTPPSTSLQVVKRRPFYIVGWVDKPGEYEFRPGLNVLQALSIAGGLYRSQERSLGRYQAEAITHRGTLRVVEAELQTLLARRARLQAELDNKDVITWPAEVVEKAKTPAGAKMMEEERLLFESRRNGIRAQVQNFERIKQLSGSEVESLKGKLDLENRQIGLIQKELDGVNSLVSRGLTVGSRQLALERVLAQGEANRIELSTAMLRAQQEQSRADNSIVELRSRARNEALTELQLTQSKLAEAAERVETARRLIFEAEVNGPLMDEQERASDLDVRPVYSIVRSRGSNAEELKVPETAPVEPGDIIKVERTRPDLRSMGRYAEEVAATNREPSAVAR
ncbi:MAG TPA: polysaccharide biosynthesis/export family protein [Microvirga sp.]|jgi:polysaccharide export outer membrane protein/exopolysaccharide production protein ExoF|nr:polysaccharide biosynthesis/export family protein [Microvirga sp.]